PGNTHHSVSVLFGRQHPPDGRRRIGRDLLQQHSGKWWPAGLSAVCHRGGHHRLRRGGGLLYTTGHLAPAPGRAPPRPRERKKTLTRRNENGGNEGGRVRSCGCA